MLGMEVLGNVGEIKCHRKNAGTLKNGALAVINHPRSLLKGDIPNKYLLYKVYMTCWLLKDTIPNKTSSFPS